MNPYEVLGVPEGAKEEECTAAFRRKVSELHPDRHRADPEKLRRCEEELKKVNEAYQALKSNNFKRYREDFRNSQGGSGFDFSSEFNEDIFDIFSHFGFNMGRSARGSSWSDFFRGGRQSSFATQVNLTLLQTLEKVTVSFSLENQRTQVELKAGIRDGEVLTYKLLDKYLVEVRCSVEPVQDFARVDNDLYHLVSVRSGDGDKGSVNLNGRSIDFNYPRDFRSGYSVTIPNQGFPYGRSRGNLVIFLVHEKDDHLLTILRDWLSLKNRV